ncbi:glucose-1-phosphate thymidylyltransferase [soil metagenome]
MSRLNLNDEYCGVILAAGHGTRMQPFSDRYPKPLLPVCDKPQIAHQIEIMRGLGIRDIYVLVGHRGYQLAAALGDGSLLDVHIRYVEQKEMLGIAHAVGQLEAHIQRPFLLFLGDIYLVPDGMERMFSMYEEQGGGAILAAREDTPQNVRRNFAIYMEADGRVTRVVEKPRHVPNRLKGVGAYLFGLSVFDAIRRTPRTALRDEYELTDAIQVMIDQGDMVRAAEVIREDINLTNPGDLLRSNLLHAQTYGFAAKQGYTHPDAKIQNSVIGANVTIQNAISIIDSVIFDGTDVTAKTRLEQVIVTPDMLVDCRYFLDSHASILGRVSSGRAFTQN